MIADTLLSGGVRFLLAALATGALASGCGGKSVRTLGGESDAEGGVEDPKERLPLERIARPVSLFESETPFRFSRAVARSDGFDLLAGRAVSPRVTLARRATLVSEPPRLALADTETEVASTPNAFNAVAAGDTLMICHLLYVGDPVLLSAHTGAYTPVTTNRALFDNGFCNGFAFVGDTGLVAVTRGRPIRPLLALMDASGYASTDAQPAFPEAEPGIDQIAVTAHAGRFAWAGYVPEASSVRVAFGSGPAPEQSVDVRGEMAPDGRPRIEPWPFSDGVTISWQETSQRARVVAIDEDGTRHLDHVIDRPDALYVSRPEIAPTPHGLVVAYSVSREPVPEVVVELFGADGRRRAEPLVIEAAGALVWSAVALGDVVLVVWSAPETLDDASGFAHPTGYFGTLYRTAP